MGFMLWLLPAAGADRPAAIHRADLLLIERLHDGAGPTGHNEFQHRPCLQHQLGRGECGALDEAGIPVSE